MPSCHLGLRLIASLVTSAQSAWPQADADKMHVTEVDEDGKQKKAHELPFKFSVMIPAFRGIAAARGIDGLVNPRGFIIVDKHQRNTKYRNIFGVGVCIAIAPLE